MGSYGRMKALATHSLSHSLGQSLTQPPTHARTHSRTHTLTHSLNHSAARSLFPPHPLPSFLHSLSLSPLGYTTLSLPCPSHFHHQYGSGPLQTSPWCASGTSPIPGGGCRAVHAFLGSVFCGHWSGELTVWSASDGEQLCRRKVDTGVQTISNHGPMVVTGGKAAVLMLWTWDKGTKELQVCVAQGVRF